ncbi:glycosyltransferase [Roseibacterium sp. SDUM158017]|uniref:glycosyltransferase n=1 Tax=Roseicyclus salinarum TaxID=3036773 RepID=UPI00241503F7|nr:glycosyltransferase [Roseibacterium sp. SDUM158017]MDG4647137.1 glycosyltransferase [Roseibacterium sp. SDUM158017]
MKATVILPTYRDWTSAARCLDALAAQDLPASEFEVIVANNNPEEAAPDDLPGAPNVRVIWEPKPGSYAARNAALAQARGTFVFFTDADCTPAPHWLSRGLHLFRTEPGCRRIAGQVVMEPGPDGWTGWSLYDSLFNLRQDDYARRGYAVTANLAVARSVFEEVGPFREDAFSGEDKEWNRRASAAGVPIRYDAAMSVRHPARTTLAENAEKKRRLAGARFVAKAGRPIARRLPRLHYLFPSPMACARIWRHPADAGVAPRLGAMWCHYRLGWTYNAEIVRLGLLGGAPERN